MRIIAALALALVPLAIAPGFSFFHDVAPKVVILLLAAAVALLLAAYASPSVHNLVETAAARWFTGLIGASMLFLVISTVLAGHRELAWSGSTWRGLGALTQIALMALALLLAAAASGDPGTRGILLRGVCVAGTLAALYGVAQYFGWDPWLPSSAYRAGEGPFQIVRPPSTLGHSDYFGAFLMWPLFIGIGLASTERERLWRALGAIAAVTGLVGVVASGSRAAVLGVIAGLCCSIALSRAARRIVTVTLVSAVVIVSGLYLSPASQPLKARLHWVGEERLGGARLLLWRDSLSMAAVHPLRGFGPETFIAEFPKYQSVELAQWYPDFYHESPHNMLLDALTGEGVIGAALMLALIGVGLLTGIRRRRSGGDMVPAIVSALAAAVIVHQFSVPTIPTALCLYTFAGLLAMAGTAQVERRAEPGFPKALKVAAVLPAVLLVWAAWRVAATDHTLASIKAQMDAGDYPAAAVLFERQGTQGHSADLYFSRRWATAAATASNSLAKLQFARLANDAAVRATRSAEQPANAWYNLAALSAAANNQKGTEDALRAAVACSPNWFKPHWVLAQVLHREAKDEEARREGARAELLDGQKHAEVAATLRQIGWH